MKITATKIPDVKRIVPDVHGDERGCFFESFHRDKFRDAGLDLNLVQDNHSISQKGTLRGLHYQLAPHAQGKLVSCIEGEVFDVAVDIRPESPSYRQWVGETLSADNKTMLYVPEGFAHGFYVMSDRAQVIYKCSDLYHPELERGIAYNDPSIGIDWPLEGRPILSTRDAAWPALD